MASYQRQTAAAWRETAESPELSSLFSISALREDDGGGARSLPGTPVSFGGFACYGGGEEVEMELSQQLGGSGGDDGERRSSRMMRNRDSALRSRARKRAYVEELEKEVRRLVNDNLKLKKQCKELKQEVSALVLPTKSLMRRTSSAQF